MTEAQQAAALATRVLDKPYIDPDGDICLLARQYLRLRETAEMVVAALEQAQSCILGDTPEDCTPEEAREDTLQKIRKALTP